MPRLGIRGLPAQSFRNGRREPIFLGPGESGDGAPTSCGAARSWSGCGVFRHSSTASSTGSSRHSKTPSTSTRLSAGWLHCLAILDRRRYSAPAAKLAYGGGPGCRALLGRGGQTGTAPWAVRCRLLPQKQVYCCSAVSEVVGQRTNPLPRGARRAKRSQWHRWSDEVSRTG